VSRGVPIPAVEGWPTKLAQAMAIRGMSMSEVAERAGVSLDTVSRAYHGKGITTLTALKLSQAIGDVEPNEQLQVLYGSGRPAA
jgi:transcriptional regulator with XRE-family HTH domain